MKGLEGMTTWGKYGVKYKSESKNLVGGYLEKDTLTFYLRNSNVTQ